MAAKKSKKPKQKAPKRAAKPARPTTRAAKKKAVARAKPAVKKAAPKKAPKPKRPAAKKAVKKAVVKKAAAKKKAVVKKAAPKKAAVKKGPVKKALARKPAPKAPVKKAAPKKAEKPAKKALKKAEKPVKKAPKAEKPVKKAEKLVEKASKKAEKPAKKAEKVVEKAPKKVEVPAKKGALAKAPPSKPVAPPSKKGLPEARPSAGKRPVPAPPVSAPKKSSPGKEAPPARRSDRPMEAAGKKRSSAPPPPAKGGKKGAPLAPVREPPPRLVTLPLPTLQAPKRPSVEERSASIEKRLAGQTDDFRKRYLDSLDMSWIYHDSALEGTVYTFEELRAGFSGQPQPITDSNLQPTFEDIRRHKEAIEYVRDFGEKKRLPVTVDVIKKIYLILHPEEGDIKTVKYRKDIPQHRLYFHEYAPPDKIAYKVRQIVDWLNDPETRKTRNGIRIAARAHYDLLRVYPFPTDSGKTARLFMNLLLLRSGLPPAILHSTERQRYYEALKGSATTVLQMVQEAVENALSSVEKLLDEHETKKRAFVS
ncbi:MAG: Fic family protein [Byssovorax sp.]